MERAMRIELTTEAWEAPILPLNYARMFISYDILLYFCLFDKRLEAIKKYFAGSDAIICGCRYSAYLFMHVFMMSSSSEILSAQSVITQRLIIAIKPFI